jgi:hypothetical protein
VEQARALLALLGSVPGEDVALIGDLNAYGDPADAPGERRGGESMVEGTWGG